MRAGRIFINRVLKIIWKDQSRNLPTADGRPYGPVGQMLDLRWQTGLLHEGADILEQVDKVDFLLVVIAQSRPRLLTRNRQNWRVAQFGVIQPRQQMGCARSGSGQTNAQLTGELGMCRRHEGSHFLMSDLYEFDVSLATLQRAQQTVDTIARIAEDSGDSPILQPLPGEIAYCPCHACLLFALAN